MASGSQQNLNVVMAINRPPREGAVLFGGLCSWRVCFSLQAAVLVCVLGIYAAIGLMAAGVHAITNTISGDWLTRSVHFSYFATTIVLTCLQRQVRCTHCSSMFPTPG
jgi:hypothetical protein